MKTLDHTLKLDDGRLLGYIETGDLKGKPLILFHGLHSSRLKAKCIEREMYTKGIRLICFDRPGMGLSMSKTLRFLSNVDKPIPGLSKHISLIPFVYISRSIHLASSLEL